MTVGIYIRVSTNDQEKGIQSQEKAISDYLNGHGINDTEFFRDRLSGAKSDRPSFKKLQKKIFDGQINVVVCWKLDRLSRSLRDGINLLCDWLDNGVRVVAVSQQLDFSGPVGQMVASVLFAIAQLDRENIRENTKRGMANAKAKGVKLGKRPKLFAKDIIECLEQGMTMTEAAKKLGKSRQACYLALKRENIKLKIIETKEKT